MTATFNILASGNPMDHLMDVPWRIAGHDLPWFSSQIAVMVLAALLLAFFIPLLAAKALNRRDRIGLGLVEIIITFVRTHIASMTLGDSASKATPALATLFLFLLINNLLGLIPLMEISNLLGLYGWGGLDASGQPLYVTPIGGTPTSGIWVAAGFAMMTFMLVMFSGYALQVNLLWKGPEQDGDHEADEPHHEVKPGANFWLAAAVSLQSRTWPLPVAIVGGVWTWLNSFVPPVAGTVGIFMWPILLFLEFCGYITKCFALCIRLVANMTSGHILLAVILSFAQNSQGWMNLVVGIPAGFGVLALMVLELLVALLQAYLFTFLSALFVGLAMNPQH